MISEVLGSKLSLCFRHVLTWLHLQSCTGILPGFFPDSPVFSPWIFSLRFFLVYEFLSFRVPSEITRNLRNNVIKPCTRSVRFFHLSHCYLPIKIPSSFLHLSSGWRNISVWSSDNAGKTKENALKTAEIWLKRRIIHHFNRYSTDMNHRDNRGRTGRKQVYQSWWIFERIAEDFLRKQREGRKNRKRESRNTSEITQR